MASRARSWWKLKTSASVSTSRPLSTARRRWSIRSASDAAGHRGEQIERHPASEHRCGHDDAPHLRVESVDLVAHDARRRSTAAGASSKASPPRSLALATSSSRKNGLPPVRVWSASTARNDGSCSNTAVEERAHVGRAEPGELEVRHRVAPLEPRQQVGGGVPSARGRRGGRCRPPPVVRPRARRGARRWPGSPSRPSAGPRTRRARGHRRRGIGRGRRRPAPAPRTIGPGPGPRMRSRGGCSRRRGRGHRGTAPSVDRRCPDRPGRPARACRRGRWRRAPARAASCRSRPRRRSVRPPVPTRSPCRARSRPSSAVRPTMTGESPARPTSMVGSYGSGGQLVRVGPGGRRRRVCRRRQPHGRGRCGGATAPPEAPGQTVLAGLVTKGLLALVDECLGHLVAVEHGSIVRPYADRAHRLTCASSASRGT